MSPALRIGDADRERAAGDLAEHFAHGRLTNDEYDERLDAIWTARTAADLAPLFEDLPRQQPAPVPQRRQPRTGFSWSRLRAVPFFPALALLIVLSMVTGFPFWVLIFFLVFAGKRHGARHHHAGWGCSTAGQR
ncbi:MAG: DUF1707 domain-containing protein [Nocardioides sp.]|nr:DUF1707 domain-containing protein [Nocardioides sp.]